MTARRYSRAARCRHAAAINEKACFWALLDSQFQDFQTRYANAPMSRFCSIVRQRIYTFDAEAFRPSTHKTWLRQWRQLRDPVQVARYSEYRDALSLEKGA